MAREPLPPVWSGLAHHSCKQRPVPIVPIACLESHRRVPPLCSTQCCSLVKSFKQFNRFALFKTFQPNHIQKDFRGFQSVSSFELFASQPVCTLSSERN